MRQFYWFVYLFVLFGLLSCSPVQERPLGKISQSISRSAKFLNSSLHFSAKTSEVLKSKKNHTFNIQIWNPENAQSSVVAVDPKYQIEVVPWMIMPDGTNHGTPKKPKVTPLLDETNNPVLNQYLAEPIYFTMPGVWQIWVYLIEDGKRIDEAVQDHEVF